MKSNVSRSERLLCSLKFLDFKSAIDTVQLHVVAEKLLYLQVNLVIIRWFCTFFIDRSQSGIDWSTLHTKELRALLSYSLFRLTTAGAVIKLVKCILI